MNLAKNNYRLIDTRQAAKNATYGSSERFSHSNLRHSSQGYS